MSAKFRDQARLRERPRHRRKKKKTKAAVAVRTATAALILFSSSLLRIIHYHASASYIMTRHSFLRPSLLIGLWYERRPQTTETESKPGVSVSWWCFSRFGKNRRWREERDVAGWSDGLCVEVKRYKDRSCTPGRVYVPSASLSPIPSSFSLKLAHLLSFRSLHLCSPSRRQRISSIPCGAVSCRSQYAITLLCLPSYFVVV